MDSILLTMTLSRVEWVSVNLFEPIETEFL